MRTPIIVTAVALITLFSGRAEAFGGILSGSDRPPRELYFLAGAGTMVGVVLPFFAHAQELNRRDRWGWQVGGTALGMAANVGVVGLCYAIENALDDSKKRKRRRGVVQVDAGPGGAAVTISF